MVKNLLNKLLIGKILAVVLVTAIFFIFIIPVESQEVQCFTTPCPPIEKTLYDLIIESDICLDQSCTVPEQPVCIDGIYFGICTGDMHFDEGKSCFGLSTEECFQKCNVVGTTCRIEDPTMCIEIFAPVCGVDGKTYSNSCFAGVNNVEIAHDGEC